MTRWDGDPEFEMKSSTIGVNKEHNIHGLVLNS